MCISPFKKKETEFAFPCGKCVDCKARRVSGWTFRIAKEAERSHSAFFITLTYDTQHVPITDRGFMSLDKQHPRLWIKSLRKINSEKLVYYLAGEYGGESNRPHYHVILFNAELSTIIGQAYATQYKLGHIVLDGKGEYHTQLWKYGHLTVGTVTAASSAYTAKYISKDGRIPMFKGDDRQPEYSNMSKGIGSNYITEAMVKWHKSDLLNRMYVPHELGKKLAMPRYYKEKIYSKYQRDRIHKHIDAKLTAEEKTETAKQRQEKRYIREAKAGRNKETRNTTL